MSFIFLILGLALVIFNRPLAVFYDTHRPAFDDHIQILNARQRVLILSVVFTIIGGASGLQL